MWALPAPGPGHGEPAVSRLCARSRVHGLEQPQTHMEGAWSAHGGRERRRALPQYLHPPSRTGVTATQTRGGWGAPRARTARDAAWNDTCTPAHHTALPGKNDSGGEGSQRGASTGEAQGGRRCSAPRGKGASHLGVCRASPHSQEQPLSPDWQGEEGRGPRLSPPRQVPVPQEKGSKFFY